jgi:hypothetical protein
MAAPTTNKGVTIVLQADPPVTVIAQPAVVRIRKLVLVAAAAAASATITDGNDKLIAMLAAPIGSSDEIDFNADNFMATGLKVSAMAGAGGTLFLYGA